ncbi:transcription factor ORG2 [Citrus sinensis]|nr:transcription factor ORG2 [Citrus sinensis]KAH9649200.1 transcription factor ORG2 [Citrus sinensis]
MCALFPPFFPSLGWPLEINPICHQQDYITETIEESPQFPQESEPQAEFDRSASFSANSGDPTMVKKLYHNASERDRRKKINSLYSSLRSLLPVADQTKKLSIPATVSRVLKYIPELQQQVERLMQKKEELLSKISKPGEISHQQHQRKIAIGSSLASISASRLSDMEILIQISSYKVKSTYGLDCEVLNEKLKSFYNEKREDLFPSNFGCKN